MKHGRVERTNATGQPGVWMCADCGKTGRFNEMVKSECPNEGMRTQTEHLLAAVLGVAKAGH